MSSRRSLALFAHSGAIGVAKCAVIVGAVATVASAQQELYRCWGVQWVFSFGSSLAEVGDVDGDGIADFVVGDPSARDANWNDYSGQALLRSGVDGHSIMRWFGVDSEKLGAAVARAGDLDGDGVPDLALGAPQYYLTGVGHVGAVYVVSGADGHGLYTWYGAATPDEFGSALADVGDLDGDLVDDLAVGAPNSSANKHQAGSVYLYSGASGAALGRIDGGGMNNFLGTAVAAAGDLDHDGVPEFAIGLPGYNANGLSFSGAIYVYSGATQTVILPVYGDAISLEMGAVVAAGSDVNGDGVPDLVAGLPRYDASGLNSKGAVRVFSGADASLLWEVREPVLGQRFGSAVALGDVDGDGRAEVLAATQPYMNPHVDLLDPSAGRRLYRWTASPSDGFGAALGVLADVNGDGLRDIAIGAVDVDSDGSGKDRGAVEVFAGNEFWLSVDPKYLKKDDAITTTLGPGVPGNLALRFVVAVNGAPTFLALLPAVALDALGFTEFDETVPSGLSGTTATLRAYAVPATGPLAATNDETIVFQ